MADRLIIDKIVNIICFMDEHFEFPDRIFEYLDGCELHSFNEIKEAIALAHDKLSVLKNNAAWVEIFKALITESSHPCLSVCSAVAFSFR